MMRNRIIVSLSAVLLMTACSEHDIMQEQASKLPIEIQGEVVQEHVTRANDNGFADGDQIGVFIVNREGSAAANLKLEGNHADNVRFTYSDANGTWTGARDIYWKNATTNVDAYSYYPFQASLTAIDKQPLTIQAKQHVAEGNNTVTGYEASDVLWAKAENVSPGTTINLRHQHIMAGVEVTLLEGKGFDTGEWATLESTVLVENTKVNALLNLQTGGVTLADNAVATIIPQQQGTDFRAVVAPQTVAANTRLLAITVDGISYEFKRSSATIFNSGKLHKFTIQVDKRLPGDYEFSLLSEAITAWENDPVSHNGSAREYVTVEVGEGEYIGDVMEAAGLDPKKMINLKVKGVFGPSAQKNDWDAPMYDGDANFRYIREHMPNLEAVNLHELRTKNVTSYYWEGGWGEPPYNQPVTADDYIPKDAFNGLKNLKYVVFPEHLEGIGDGAFVSTALRGSLILPEGLKHIGSSLVSSYGNQITNLTGDLYIPSTVEYIGDGAFGNTYFTGELVLPEKMVYLGNAFETCPYMAGVIHVPDGIDVLNRTWPDQMGGQVVIPQGVKKIAGFPRGAATVVIPEGVESIESHAFWGTSKLRDVHLPSTVKRIADHAFWDSGITHINLPEGLEAIEDWAFVECKNLLDIIEIPSTVTQIREGAFADCVQLTGVDLPAGLQEIKKEAFRGCSSLNYIQCRGSVPPVIADDAFSGVEKDNYTVVVPEGAVEAYKNADGWKGFKRISAYRNFVCRPMQAKLLNKGNVRDLVLNADDSWTVKSCPDWVHLDKTSGTKKTELEVTIDALAHGSADREGTVVFQLDRNDENGEAITCEYKVYQYDYECDEDAVLQLQKATKGSRGGIDILFVGDGYDAEDIAHGTYLTHMKQEMKYFFAVEPYKTYKDYFNVSVAMAMSYESGVVDSPDKWRSTKFNITYGAGAGGRLSVPFNDIADYVINYVTSSPITSDNVGRSLIICVPNSDAYEGICAMYSDGSAIAVCPHSQFDYPNDARGLIQHEAGGHGWGKLGDEYVYHQAYIQNCTCLCCTHVDDIEAKKSLGWYRNLSLSGKFTNHEWYHLMTHPQYSDIVDLYEGGHMHARGIYRSEVNSCMNNNVPYFSTVSRQAIVERIMEASGGTFDFETFVANDSRETGDKFLTRSQLTTPWQQVRAVHTAHHGPVIMKGSLMDNLKQNRRK